MQKNHQTNNNGELVHQPVLVREVIECLDPKAGESYLDLTAGYGGHAGHIIAATASPGKAILVDRDRQAVTALKKRFRDTEIIHSDYLSICRKLSEQGRSFDMILADLGVSSAHLDQASRGFAFSKSGPLDMRMDQTQDVCADDLVNRAEQSELLRILREYGQEPKAETIAKRIVANRPIKDTQQLATIIAKCYGPWARRSRVHPATRTFQALRIAVNEELDQLFASLPLMESLLAPGGRLAIISFHSLEDRLVKNYFADNAGDRYDAELRILTRKPIVAGAPELRLNPRARSAKLRAVAKIKNTRKDRGQAHAD